MRDKFTSQNFGDFRYRYQGCFGWLILEDKKVFVYISKVGDSVVSFEDANGEKYTLYRDAKYEFEFLPVDRGYHYGKDGDFYLLQRVPARQFRRGVNYENTKIINKSNTEIELNIKSLANIFSTTGSDNKYRYLVDAACALSKYFAIDDEQRVRFLGRAVGRRQGGALEVDPMIVQEVQDVRNRNNYSFAVVGVEQ